MGFTALARHTASAVRCVAPALAFIGALQVPLCEAHLMCGGEQHVSLCSSRSTTRSPSRAPVPEGMMNNGASLLFSCDARSADDV